VAAEQLALTPSEQFPDFLGNLVSVGDRVAVVFRDEQLRIGIVDSFSTRKLLGYDVPTMRVKWEKSSGYLPEKVTAVDFHSRLFLKLFDEK
jgi:hypothetical protein